MGRRAQWTEYRKPVLIPPGVEALGGKTYRQSGQTAGTLSGRRGKAEWYQSNGQIVKVFGGVWRLIEVSARVYSASIGDATVDILAQVPGAPSPVSIFSTGLTILSGQKEATGGVLKSDFRLLPVGTLLSMSASGGGLEGGLIAVAKSGIPSFDYSIMAVIGSNWASPITIPTSAGVRPMIFPLVYQLWFAVGANTVRSPEGAAYRTEDGGDLWSVAPSLPRGAIYTVAKDAGGRLWCASRVNGGLEYSEIYYSDDGGDTWTLSQTINTALADDTWKILPHPSDEDILVALTTKLLPSIGAVDYTLNRGSSWSRNDNSNLYIGNSPPLQNDATLLSNNRIVVIGYIPGSIGGVGLGAIISDDWGANWTVVFTASGVWPRMGKLFVSSDGTRLGFLYVEDDTVAPGVWHLVLSTNGATSFVETSLATELHDIYSGAAQVVTGNPHTIQTPGDALYILIDNIPGDQEVFRLAPVSASGVWTNLTSSLPGYIYRDAALAKIASTEGGSTEHLAIELHYRVVPVGQ